MIGMTVCSGIGAPERAAPWIDWRYQSEIDKFPSAVLAARFPDAVNLGDMTKFKDWPDANVDVLCGGTPCQSFSVAGLRKGLADPRGNLALTYLAIAARYRPRWLVWENVPGVLSSVSHPAPDPRPPEIDLDSDDGPRDGETVVVTDEYRSVESHALWCFMAGAAGLGYHGGYITIDAQHVQTPTFERAIPQRRERVFFVGHLGDWRRAAAVLFEPESLSGHPAPRREAGKGVAPCLSARTQGGGGLGTDFDLDGGLVANTLKGEGFDASEDGTGRQNLIPVSNSGDVAYCLAASAQQSLDAETETLIAFDCKGSQDQTEDNGTCPTLRAMAGSHQNGGGQMAVAIQERAVSENPSAGPGGAGVNADGAAYTIEAREKVQAVAFAQNQRGELRTSDVSPQLTTGGGKPGEEYPAIAFDMRGRDGGAMPEGPHDTANLRAASGGSSRGYVAEPWAVRRLTPKECERLMGFPDGWTQIPWRGKPADQCPDGPRYKALGNSWAVNCGELIFDRIRAVEDLKL